jgi:hypothetical protein
VQPAALVPPRPSACGRDQHSACCARASESPAYGADACAAPLGDRHPVGIPQAVCAATKNKKILFDLLKTDRPHKKKKKKKKKHKQYDKRTPATTAARLLPLRSSTGTGRFFSGAPPSGWVLMAARHSSGGRPWPILSAWQHRGSVCARPRISRSMTSPTRVTRMPRPTGVRGRDFFLCLFVCFVLFCVLFLFSYPPSIFVCSDRAV